MRKKPLVRIEELTSILPTRDERLAKKFLKERNFEGILELVESDLYKAMMNDDNSDEYVANLAQLREEVVTYMSNLDIPDDTENYEYFI